MIKPDKIIRSKRKTLAISVDATGKLIVRAPLHCSEARILAFIEKKSDWIKKHQAKTLGKDKLLPSEDLDGFKFSFLGGICEIKKQGARTRYDQGNGILYIPENGTDEHVRRWLKSRAKEILTPMVENRARLMGTTYRAVSISSAKTRWGSCSADNSIRFTFRLLYAPMAVIDYVVVHELSHTIHKDHSKAFWQEVEKYRPDWKIARKWLKDRRYLMQIF